MKCTFPSLLLFAGILFFSASAKAQLIYDTIPMDRSPMDVSYYPYAYPQLSAEKKIQDELIARVLYSRPQKAGRNIFGGLVKYGEVWRLGANEATEIDFFKDVLINGKKIKKGRYTLFAIPGVKDWTFIVNATTDIWGSFNYDAKNDLVRIQVPVKTAAIPSENFTMFFEKNGKGFLLNTMWDSVKVQLPVYLQ